MLRVLMTTLVAAALVATTLAQTPAWNDSHGIIDVQKAMDAGLEDNDALITAAVADYDSLLKRGIVLRDRAEAVAVLDFVDFCDYVRGCWDTDYSTTSPGSFKAGLENDADRKLEDLWSCALGSMRLHRELLSEPRYDKDSGPAEIQRCLDEMSDSGLARACSPSLRKLLPDRLSLVRKFLQQV
ncbi:MAG: hypothetical protein JSS66_06910 [Armatimonadetes bacterium]|nr:hypothetical protein [Armatimonadota bacterium]